MTEKHIEEAQNNHWGTFCKEWATCEKIGLCNELCPDGGKPKDGDPE